ncbi:MAG: AraC family transcriptional regulator [Algicola sp.]|nr:AraC family transcriptional regulator [Algicola sp.]
MLENIVLLIFFLHLLVAAFLLNTDKGNILSNKLLASYLIVLALDISNFLFPDFYSAHPNLNMVRSNIALFTAPFLYGYVNAVVYNDFKLKRKHYLHCLPFVFACLALVPRFFSVGTEGKQVFYDNFNAMPETIFILSLVYIQVGMYIVAMFKILNRQRKIIIENYSDEHHLTNRWLTQFLFLFSLIYIFALARTLYKFSADNNTVEILTLVMMFCAFLSICWILWQALNHPQLFVGVNSKIEVLADKPSVEELANNQKDNATTTHDDLIAKLENYMRLNKPFLNPSLSVESLAKQIEVPGNELSILINRKIGQHFFDFVNTYRINFAAEMLSDKNNQKKTVMEILYDAGFNSKSSFNTAFKKHKQVTPSQYRKNNV